MHREACPADWTWPLADLLSVTMDMALSMASSVALMAASSPPTHTSSSCRPTTCIIQRRTEKKLGNWASKH
jgi:hypothetical protein